MGKKKFIDKKSAATYQLVCRVTDETETREGGAEPSLADERAFARIDVRAAQLLCVAPHAASIDACLVASGALQTRGGVGALEDDSRDDRSQATFSQYSRAGKLSRARRAELIEARDLRCCTQARTRPAAAPRCSRRPPLRHNSSASPTTGTTICSIVARLAHPRARAPSSWRHPSSRS